MANNPMNLWLGKRTLHVFNFRPSYFNNNNNVTEIDLFICEVFSTAESLKATNY